MFLHATTHLQLFVSVIVIVYDVLTPNLLQISYTVLNDVTEVATVFANDACQ